MYRILARHILKRRIPFVTPRFLQTTASIIDARIQTAGKRQLLKTITNEFTQVKDTDLKLSKSSYEIILEAFIKLRRKNQPLTRLFDAYNTMLSQGGEPTPRIYAVMIRILCERDLEVKKTAGMLERQTARTGEAIDIKTEDNITRAIGLFREAIEANKTSQLDLALCNQLLLGLSHHSYVNDALFVFEYMKKETGLDAQSMAAMVSVFGTVGNLRAANEYFERYINNKPRHDRRAIVHHALINAYVSTGDIKGALDIVQTKMKGVQRTAYPYNKIIQGAFQFEQLDIANDLFTQFCSTNSSLPAANRKIFGIYLTGYSQVKDFERAKEAYHRLLAFDVSTQYGHLANYVHACTENKLMDEALDAVLTMSRTGLMLEMPTNRHFLTTLAQVKGNKETTIALTKIMSNYSKHRFIDAKTPIVQLSFELTELFKDDIISVLSILRTLKTYAVLPNPAISASLLNKYMQVRSDHSQFEELSKKLNLPNFAALFETVFQRQSTPNEMCQTALDILKDMKKLNVKLPLAWYLRISTRMMKYDEFEHHWKKLFAPYVPLNPYTEKPIEIATRIDENQELIKNEEEEKGTKIRVSESELLSEEALNAALGGRFDKAIDIIDRKIVQQEKVPTPEVIRDIILLSKKKKDQLDIAERIYGLVSEPLIKSNDAFALSTLYNSMLMIYAQNNRLNAAKKIYQKLSNEHLRHDGDALAAFITCLVKKNDQLDPYVIYKEARNQKTILPTYFYNLVLSHLSNQQKLQEALNTFDEMKQSNVIPNTVTYATLISNCLRSGAENYATRYFQEMIASAKYHPRIGVYNQMMQFYLQQKQDREKVLEYYHLSKHHHVQPTAHTFRLLIEAYATVPDYDIWASRQLLDSMRNEFNIKPTGIHYAMLIRSYGSLQHDVQSAFDIYNDMLTKHTEKDGIASFEMLKAFFDNNMDDRAFALYEKITTKNKSTLHIEHLLFEKYNAKNDLANMEVIFSRNKLNKETHQAMYDAYLSHGKQQEANAILDLINKSTLEQTA